MNNISCVVSCPIDTYSGYGGRSRDLVRALIETRPDWDIKILGQRWGNTRQGYLQDHKDTFFTPKIITSLTYKPKVWIQVTIPNEFQSVGDFNIGFTAGIETTVCDASWLEGCNRMDLNVVSSTFSKNIFETIKYQINDSKQTPIGNLTLQKPMTVLLEGVDIDVYKKVNAKENKLDLTTIGESFCFLVMGHWMQGNFGQDRKNIPYTVKAFLETFKNKENQPALILKTLQTNSSIIDQSELIKKIDAIRKTVKGKLPNIYLIHGDLKDEQVNELYNHPKIRALISLTKGEGYGRPLAEFASLGKPVIASNWSGHLDFLLPQGAVLVPGTLENVDDSAVTKGIILKEGQWFKPNDAEVGTLLRSVHKEYNVHLKNAEKQEQHILDRFTYTHMKQELGTILDKFLPTFPEKVQLNLPTLKLPKLQKIQ